MARVLVCGEDQFVLFRVGRELSIRNHSHEVTKLPVKKDDLMHYDLIVIHSSWRLPHLFEFVTNLVRGHERPVIYLSGDSAIGAIRPILDDPWFAFLDETRIDAELGIAATLLLKTAKALREMEEKARKSTERADLRRMMDQCKNRLMASGATEEEAHALILKTAMDRQISKYAACTALMREKMSEHD